MSEHVYISMLTNLVLSDGNIEDIALWSLEKEKYYLVSASKDSLGNAIEEVKDRHDVFVKGIHLKDNFPILEAYTIIPFLLGCDTVTIIDVCADGCSLIDLGFSSFSNYEKITTLEIVDDEYFSRLSSEITSSCPIFKAKLRTFTALYSNLASIDLKLMTRGSFLLDQEVRNRKSDTHLDCLKLIEFSKALEVYQHLFSSSVAHLPAGLASRKTTFINSILSSTPTPSSNLPEINNYPKVYKFLSAYFYKCSIIKSEKNVINSSFLYCFRALEAFLEGYLIMKGIASIGNAYYPNGNLYKKEAFKIHNKFVPGFGSKWNKAKNDNFLLRTIRVIDPSLISSIDTAHNIRNVFNLTHGDLKLTDNVLYEIQSDIKRFIIGLDATLAHPGFGWDTILNEFDRFLTYNFIDDFRSTVARDFNIEILDNSANAA